MDFKKYLTNKNVALLGTITFHVVLFAVFTHVHLKVNKPEHSADLVINFIDQKEIETPIEEEEIVEKADLLKEFDGPITNQASSRSNEKSVEDLRSSMKSLEGARDDSDTDLFSDDAKKRNIPTTKNKQVDKTDGKGEAERKSENAFTGRSTINYYLKNRYNNKLPNPIYTCISGGKVYIDIKVNQQGKVIDASFNKSKSTTSNECLVETALKYAKRSKFNSDFKASDPQKGYITYDFHKN
ncbi:MAG: hypothetical protein KAG37_10910 [Flavobacteriales bacterium]|nr:hypothetical protein [Flavobacteriales bacterium]